jgi:FkbM family methyltransferase
MYDLRIGRFRTPGGHDLLMTYRDHTNDANTLTASLDQDEYGLPHDLEGVALDIGGYLGSVGIALAVDNPDLRVLIVEPVPPNIDLIRTNIEANGVGARVWLIEGAVGKSGFVDVSYGFTGSESATHHAFVGNSSILATSDAAATISYPATTLQTLVAMAGGDVAFCKIDTEGAEFAFLDSPAVGKVETFVGEWHNTHGTQDDIIGLLSETHVVTFSGPFEGPGGFRAVRR